MKDWLSTVQKEKNIPVSTGKSSAASNQAPNDWLSSVSSKTTVSTYKPNQLASDIKPITQVAQPVQPLTSKVSSFLTNQPLISQAKTTIQDKSKEVGSFLTKARDYLSKEISDFQLVKPVYAPAEEQGMQTLPSGKVVENKPIEQLVEDYRQTPLYEVNRKSNLFMGNFSQALTGGIIKPTLEAPKTVADKVIAATGQAIGTVGSLRAIGGVFDELVEGSATVGKFIEKYPKLAKWAIPFVKNTTAFDLYGQLDPDLQDRFKKLSEDTLLSIPFTLLGALPSAKFSVPASFGLGFGLAKMSGADDTDAFISGTILGVLDGAGRLGAKGNINKQVSDKIIRQDALSILNEYTTTKLTSKSSPAEIRKAYLNAVKQAHPDKGGDPTTFKGVVAAYEFLTGKTIDPSFLQRGNGKAEQPISGELPEISGQKPVEVTKKGELKVVAPETAGKEIIPGQPVTTTPGEGQVSTVAKLPPEKSVSTQEGQISKPVATQVEAAAQNEDIPVYRAGKMDVSKNTEQGISFSTDESYAKSFGDSRNKGVENFYIDKNAKILKDIPDKFKDYDSDGSYTVKNGAELEFAGKEEFQEIIDYARENGYDAVDLSGFNAPAGQKGEAEIRVINPKVIKNTEQKPVDLLKKSEILSNSNISNTPAQKGDQLSTKPLAADIEKLKSGERTSAISDVPTAKIPHKDGYSRLQERVEAQILQENGEKYNFDPETAKYDKKTLKGDAEAALKLLEENPDQAIRIARGLEEPPETVTANSVSIAAALKARAEGNDELFKEIINIDSRRLTRYGQEIVMTRGNFNDHSPQNFIKRVLSARLDKLGSSIVSDAGGKKSNKVRAMERIDREVERLQKRIHKKVYSKENKIKIAQKIIDELTCK